MRAGLRNAPSNASSYAAAEVAHLTFAMMPGSLFLLSVLTAQFFAKCMPSQRTPALSAATRPRSSSAGCPSAGNAATNARCFCSQTFAWAAFEKCHPSDLGGRANVLLDWHDGRDDVAGAWVLEQPLHKGSPAPWVAVDDGVPVACIPSSRLRSPLCTWGRLPSPGPSSGALHTSRRPSQACMAASGAADAAGGAGAEEALISHHRCVSG